MECPNCRQTMAKQRVGPATVDECPNCRGIWFDADRFEEAKDGLAPEVRWMDVSLWRQLADATADFQPLNCPRCRNTALTALVDRKADVIVRFCTECGGTWLNAEGLRAVVAALEREMEGRTTLDYAEESLRQAKDLVTGEKGLISEWKDLVTVLRLFKYRLFAEHPGLTAVMKGLQKTLPL